MKKLWETGIILFAAMGFWGMIYPDLCFTDDICTVADVPSAYVSSGINAAEEEDIYTRICRAQPGQIRIRSRLLENLQKESKGKENVVSEK